MTNFSEYHYNELYERTQIHTETGSTRYNKQLCLMRVNTFYIDKKYVPTS